MEDTAADRRDSYFTGLRRRAVITATAIILNSLLLVVFMWVTTYNLWKDGDTTWWVNATASLVRSSTLIYNGVRLSRFLRRGYSIKSIGEVVRSFGILELINSFALLVFLFFTLPVLEDVGFSKVLWWGIILVKAVVLAYFTGMFVASQRQSSTEGNENEYARKQLRDLVGLALADAATIVVFTMLVWYTLMEDGDSRTGWVLVFAIAQTITLLVISAAYVLNHPREQT